jgi:hypothetical protein
MPLTVEMTALDRQDTPNRHESEARIGPPG